MQTFLSNISVRWRQLGKLRFLVVVTPLLIAIFVAGYFYIPAREYVIKKGSEMIRIGSSKSEIIFNSQSSPGTSGESGLVNRVEHLEGEVQRLNREKADDRLLMASMRADYQKAASELESANNELIQQSDQINLMAKSLAAYGAASGSPVATSSDSSSSSAATSGKVNINTATADQLDALPGIGPSYAKAIIDHRPYTTIDGLLNVPGIGQSTFDKLKDLVEI